MIVIGVVGVLALSLVPHGVSLWKNIRRGWLLYFGFFCMKLEMDQKCGFG